MKQVMITAAAAVLVCGPVWVWAAGPASAGPGQAFCARPNGSTGSDWAAQCNACAHALGSEFDATLKYDCGWPGAVKPDGMDQPHCMIAGIQTGRVKPACFGQLNADGSVTETQ